jgi:hypothetical protein
MSEESKDRIIESFAANLVRLGNECRDWAAENKRLKAEIERLRRAMLDAADKLGRNVKEADQS